MWRYFLFFIISSQLLFISCYDNIENPEKLKNEGIEPDITLPAISDTLSFSNWINNTSEFSIDTLTSGLLQISVEKEFESPPANELYNIPDQHFSQSVDNLFDFGFGAIQVPAGTNLENIDREFVHPFRVNNSHSITSIAL